MSEYIKLEGAISKIVNTPTRIITDDLTALADRQHEIIDMLSELPTIEVSEDAISREWLIKALDNLDWYDFDMFYKVVENAPSVVPQPKEGEWKWETNDICHNCGYKIPHLERIVGETVLMDSKDWNYCPNCGSRMKGAE